MKYINSISGLFLAAAVVAITFWFLADKCKKSAPDHTSDTAVIKEQQRLRDSAHQVTLQRDLLAKADSARWKRTADSALLQLNKTRKLLTASQVEAAELAVGVEQAKADNDTAAYIQRCNDLAVKVGGLNILVDRYKAQNDSLITAKDSVERVAQTRLQEKGRLYVALMKSCQETDRRCSQILTDYKKVARKADKKFTIGIGGTAGITTDGKPGGAIGITISRTLIPL